MNVETTRAALVVTLQLDEDEARTLHEWAVRVVRLTDGGLTCPLREGLCLQGRDLADELGRALGVVASVYPETGPERTVSARRVWYDDDDEYERHGPRCGMGYSFGGPPRGVVYCARVPGHEGDHRGPFVWAAG